MADIFMFRPQVYWVAFLAAPFIGSLPAGPAQAERRFCAYTVHVSAAGVAETPIPGARLRAKGRYIDSGNPSRYITGLGTHRVGAKLEAMIAAEKCLNAAIRSRTKPEFCRSTYRHTGIGSRRNFGQVVSWPIQNLGGSALRTICDRARRFNLAQLQYVRIVAVRVHGDHNCNLGHRRARRPRRTLLYQVPSWSCSSGRPVPRSALPGAITNECPKVRRPVCGAIAGGQNTFPNRCMAIKAGARVLHNGQCQQVRSGNAAPRSGRPLPPPTRLPGCSRRYRPVCANTRRGLRTFVNACRARQYRARIVYFGRCRRR